MDNCEKYNENALPKKEDFYRHLMEDINDTDYAHAKRVCKGFEIKSLWEYHDLYVQSDIILLADKFENFRKLCINIYELDPAKFLSAPGLAWEEAKADILTDKDMLLLVEKCIRGAICHSIYRYGKANDRCDPFLKSRVWPFLKILSVILFNLTFWVTNRMISLLKICLKEMIYRAVLEFFHLKIICYYKNSR